MTAFAATIAGDYATWDGTESVTFRSTNVGSGSHVTISSVTALRRALSRTDRQTLEIAAKHDATVWHLPAVLLRDASAFHKHIPGWLTDWVTLTGAAATPAYFCGVKANDLITDAGSLVWIVGQVSLDTLGTRWRCVCTRLES
jgi:hypothetical protein